MNNEQFTEGIDYQVLRNNAQNQQRGRIEVLKERNTISPPL